MRKTAGVLTCTKRNDDVQTALIIVCINSNDSEVLGLLGQQLLTLFKREGTTKKQHCRCIRSVCVNRPRVGFMPSRDRYSGNFSQMGKSTFIGKQSYLRHLVFSKQAC